MINIKTKVKMAVKICSLGAEIEETIGIAVAVAAVIDTKAEVVVPGVDLVTAETIEMIIDSNVLYTIN